MYDKALGLIPVFEKDSEPGEARLADLNSHDITLNTFLRFIFQSINSNWKWSNATDQDLYHYIVHTLLSFCDDHEKIKKTQEMIHTLMAEKEFCEFLLRGTKQYERFYSGHDEDYAYRLSQSLEEFVLELDKQFSNLSERSKEVLEPFIHYFNGFKNGMLFTQIAEFNKLFIKPMEFTCYLGKHSLFKNKAEEVIPGKFYGDDSTFIRDILKGSVVFHDASCVIFSENGEVSASTLPVLDMPEQAHRANLPEINHLNYKMVTDILGVELDMFVHNITPTSEFPLQVVIRVERKNGGYELSLTLTEPPDGHQLVFESGYSRYRDVLKLKKNDETTSPLSSKKRTDQQLKLIGKTKSRYIEDQHGYSSSVYDMKVKYFYASFFRKCQIHAEEFGTFLVELRYLAFVAEQYLLMGRETPIVFPTVLAKEENKAWLVELRNPVLVFDNKERTPVVPNNVRIDEKRRIQMLTGPNQNGKSRYIDSIALNQIFCQAGWPVFAESAEMSPKTDLRVHYVHSGVGISGESRFSHECQRMRKVFDGMRGEYPLIIIDEPYTGTNHIDAETLLKELLQACSDEDVTVFLTTHFHGLIPFIEEMANGRNLHCYVDGDGKFTYQIKGGASTKSNALDVASTAGVRFEQLKEALRTKKDTPSLVVNLPETDDLPF